MISGVIFNDAVMNGIAGTYVQLRKEEPSERCKKLVAEANERIRQDRARQARAVVKASKFVAIS